MMLVTMCQVTANHGGHFTFRVCPVSRGGDPSQDCLDTNLLTVLNTVSSQCGYCYEEYGGVVAEQQEV